MTQVICWAPLLLLIKLLLLSESSSASPLPAFNWTLFDESEWLVAFNGTVKDVPDEIDYREKGYVTSVDKQGSCHTHWSFAATGAIEALMARTNNRQAVKLSSQQLLDCSPKENGCARGGSSPLVAMQYAVTAGLQYADDYRYVGEKRACKYNADKVAFRFRGMNAFKRMDESKLKLVVGTVGPVVTGIFKSTSFDAFKGSGIFSTNEIVHLKCVHPNHYVLIVGYGTSQSTDGSQEDYWILKNSFGPDWGDGGYVKFRRNVELNAIGNFVVWPLNAPS